MRHTNAIRAVRAVRHFSASSSPVSGLALNALEFPYLKRDRVDRAVSHQHDHARGTCLQDAPLVIMHGLLGSAGNWRTTAPKLSAHRRILSLDVRNHGASPHVEDMRFGACAEDVLSTMDARGVDKAIVMGHSLGGKIAMAAGLKHPDRILAVISVDMSPFNYALSDDGWTGVSSIVDACARVPMSEFRSRSEVDHFLKPLIPDYTTRAFVMQNVIVETRVDPLTGAKKQSVEWRCNLPALHRALGRIAGFDIQAPIVSYPNPSLFIGGGNSPYLTAKQKPTVERIFPSNEWVTIPGAGHWVHVEKPNEFVDIVKEYLTRMEHHM